MVFSFGMTASQDRDEPLCYMILDATRAHWHSPATRPVYIRFPAGVGKPGECGRLNKSMYGTRDAAANWEKFSGDVFKKNGFELGKGNPCLLYHPARKQPAFKHGDDVVCAGTREELKKLHEAASLARSEVEALEQEEAYDRYS